MFTYRCDCSALILAKRMFTYRCDCSALVLAKWMFTYRCDCSTLVLAKWMFTYRCDCTALILAKWIFTYRCDCSTLILATCMFTHRCVNNKEKERKKRERKHTPLELTKERNWLKCAVLSETRWSCSSDGPRQRLPQLDINWTAMQHWAGPKHYFHTTVISCWAYPFLKGREWSGPGSQTAALRLQRCDRKESLHLQRCERKESSCLQRYDRKESLCLQRCDRKESLRFQKCDSPFQFSSRWYLNAGEFPHALCHIGALRSCPSTALHSLTNCI